MFSFSFYRWCLSHQATTHFMLAWNKKPSVQMYSEIELWLPGRRMPVVICTYFGTVVLCPCKRCSLSCVISAKMNSSSACLRLRFMLPLYWSPRAGHTCKGLLGSNFLVVDFGSSSILPAVCALQPSSGNEG